MVFGSSKAIALTLFGKGTIGRLATDEGVFRRRVQIELFLYVWYQCFCYTLLLAENIWREFEVWVVIDPSEHQHNMIPPCVWLKLLHHTVKVVQNSHDAIKKTY